MMHRPTPVIASSGQKRNDETKPVKSYDVQRANNVRPMTIKAVTPRAERTEATVRWKESNHARLCSREHDEESIVRRIPTVL